MMVLYYDKMMRLSAMKYMISYILLFLLMFYFHGFNIIFYMNYLRLFNKLILSIASCTILLITINY